MSPDIFALILIAAIAFGLFAFDAICYTTRDLSRQGKQEAAILGGLVALLSARALWLVFS